MVTLPEDARLSASSVKNSFNKAGPSASILLKTRDEDRIGSGTLLQAEKPARTSKAKIMGTSKNPNGVFRGSSEKTANSL